MKNRGPGKTGRKTGKAGKWTKRLGLLLLSLGRSSFIPGLAQIYHVPAHSVEVVNGCARLQPCLSAATANPAVMATGKGPRVAAGSENAWSLPELRFSKLIAALPVGNGSVALALEQSGDDVYRESGYSLGYGLPLGKANLGMLLNYRQFHAAGYRAVHTGSATLGLRIQLFPDLLTGISFSVPFAVIRNTNHTDRPAGDYRIEMGYLASIQVSFFAAWVKTDGLTAAAEIGIDYAFADHFFFVAGLQGRTEAPFGKTGWANNGWKLAIYTAYQAPLGFSPGLSLSWDKPEKKTAKAPENKVP